MRAKWSVFVFFLALYLLTAGGHTYSTDEESMFFVTAAMARRGGFDTPSMQEAPVSAPMRGIDGKLYAPYGLLPSALALPFYHVGAIVSSFLPRIYQGYFLRFAITFFLNPFFTALTAVLLLEAILVLGYSFRVALVTTFLFGLGTMAWVYAKTFFSEPLLTLLWVGAFLALIKYHKHPELNLLAASGCLLGFAVTTKVTALVVLPIYFLYLTWLLYQRRGDLSLRQILRALMVWGLPALAIVAGVGVFNFARFGNVLQTGYGEGLALFRYPLLQGLYGLLLSPGKSLFLYSPILLLAIPSFFLFASQHRAEALLCLGIICVNLGLFGIYRIWAGGSSWGPRFLVILLPFFMLPLAALFASPMLRRHKYLYWIIGALALISVLVQILGGIVNFDLYINLNIPERLRTYDPSFSPILGQLDILRTVLTNPNPIGPMPEGANTRFSWFINPALAHPLDFWFLYILNTELSLGEILFLVTPILFLCLIGLFWSSRVLWRTWQRPSA